MRAISHAGAPEPDLTQWIVNRARALALVVLILTSALQFATPARAKSRPLAGVNIAGGEFGVAPGVYGKDYTYPSVAELNYARNKGFSIIRAPFLWERLQPRLDKGLDPAELARLKLLVDETRARGMTIILDAHN